MFGHGTQYGRKKESAIAALLSERTIPDAARVAGVSIKTLRRWLKLPDFQKDLLEARRERFYQSTARLEQNLDLASKTILMLMADQKVSDMVRFKAADSMLIRASERIVLESIEQSLSELARAVEDEKERGRDKNDGAVIVWPRKKKT